MSLWLREHVRYHVQMLNLEIDGKYDEFVIALEAINSLFKMAAKYTPGIDDGKQLVYKTLSSNFIDKVWKYKHARSFVLQVCSWKQFRVPNCFRKSGYILLQGYTNRQRTWAVTRHFIKIYERVMRRGSSVMMVCENDLPRQPTMDRCSKKCYCDACVPLPTFPDQGMSCYSREFKISHPNNKKQELNIYNISFTDSLPSYSDYYETRDPFMEREQRRWIRLLQRLAGFHN